MANLKSLNEQLSAVASILDTVASGISEIPLNPSKENIARIGQALSLIFNVQQQIYKVAPELEPEFLKWPSPYPKEVGRRFGEILIMESDLCAEKNYYEAIALLESYISENPPVFFIQMARNRIKRLKNTMVRNLNDF